MEAAQNSIFIMSVSEWPGGVSFSEMNKRPPEVSAAIKLHDTTGMAESFEQINDRLKQLLISVEVAYPDGSNILCYSRIFDENDTLFVPLCRDRKYVTNSQY